MSDSNYTMTPAEALACVPSGQQNALVVAAILREVSRILGWTGAAVQEARRYHGHLDKLDRLSRAAAEAPPGTSEVASARKAFRTQLNTTRRFAARHGLEFSRALAAIPRVARELTKTTNRQKRVTR